jgi:hypothetical protein
MKKVILLLVFVCCRIVAFSQLKVTNDSRIGVELSYGKTSAYSFTTSILGEQYMRNVFERDLVSMKVHKLADCPYGINYWGTDMQVNTEDNRYLAVNYIELIFLLVQSIKK